MASDASETGSGALYDLDCTDCSFEATVEGDFEDALDVTADHQDGAGETDSEHFVDLEFRGHDSIASSE